MCIPGAIFEYEENEGLVYIGDILDYGDGWVVKNNVTSS